MDPKSELEALLATLPGRGVVIVKKDKSWWWKALGWLVYVITLGQNKTFMTDYVTTINRTIGVPTNWDEYDDLSKLEVLTHELTHVEQARRHTFPVMALSYLLVFLPLGLAYARYRLEREAYVNGYRVLLKHDPSLRQAAIDRGVEQMTSGQYGWAWPFPGAVRRWFESQL